MKPGDLVSLDKRVFGHILEGSLESFGIDDPVLVVVETREIADTLYLSLLNTHSGAQFIDKAEHYVRVDEDISKDSP